MADKVNLTPEQRVKILCDLSNTALSIFFSNLKSRFPDMKSEERIKYLSDLVKERERIRRL